MRSLRSELTSVLTVLLILGAVALVLPYSALDFKASPEPLGHEAAAAFVRLPPSTEAAALKAAKSSWQGTAVGVRRLRADLSFGELPETPDAPVMGVAERTPPPPPALLELTRCGYLPTQAASPAVKIVAEPADRPTAVFPREELLKTE